MDVSEVLSQLSVVSPYGLSNSRCGYCKKPSGNRSYMIMGGGGGNLGLKIEDYKGMMDRGWRRSGNLLYKPDLKNACCQQYTIRVDSNEMHPSKEHRQALNRWSNYILGDEYIKAATKLYPVSKEEKKRRNNYFDLVHEVHRPELEYVKLPPDPAHKLEITLEPNTFTKEKYALFKHYQEKVHNDFRNSPDGFIRFLCTNPFKPPFSESPDGEKYGAFHQCYRLNGRLVAMSVIDLLPDCVSGVYFIYHQDIEKWSPGKLSALREAALAKEAGYRYYYMGFYIHTCPKMRYKGGYQPAYLLDPEYYNWHLFDKSFASTLDTTPYISLTKQKKLAGVSTVNDTIAGINKAEEGGGGTAMTATKKLKVTETSGKAPDDVDMSNHEDGEDSEGEDEEDDFEYSSKTVFSANFSGAMLVEEIEESYKLGSTKILVRGTLAQADMLVGWDDMLMRDPTSVSCKIGEFVATVGKDLGERIIIKLS